MDYVKAFFVGGAVCALVQILMEKTKMMPGRIMVLLVTSGCLLGALGLYEPMLEGLANLDFVVLSASVPGIVLSILLLARFMSWLFRTHYSIAFHGILGIVLASTVVIIPLQYTAGEIVWSVVCCCGGFLLAFLLAKLDRRPDR